MPKQDLKTLSGRLAYAMELRRLGQSELSRRTGVRQPSINDILSGRTRSMKAATMVKLSAALQVHGTWLATGRPPIEKLSQITNFPKDRDEEISDLVEGYANAPAEVQAIVYDILGKYMSRNKQKKLENGK